MSHDYAGDPTNYPENVPIEDSADPLNSTAIRGSQAEALADRTAYLEGANVLALNWNEPRTVPGDYTAPAANVVLPCGVVPDANGVANLVLCRNNGHIVSMQTEYQWTQEVGGAERPEALAAANIAGTPTILIVAEGGGGVSYWTDDFGATWTGFASTFTNPVALAYFAATSKWLAADASATRMHYTSSLASWSNGTGAGAAPTTPRRIRCNSTTAIAIYHTAATKVARSTDGIAWTLPTISAADHDWRGLAYSTQHSLWMAVAADGVMATSSNNGATWVEGALPIGAQDVIAVGRYFVAVLNIYGNTAFAITKDNGTTWRSIVFLAGTSLNAFETLLIHDGRLIALGRDPSNRVILTTSIRSTVLGSA
jgi:hypothetical protein